MPLYPHINNKYINHTTPPFGRCNLVLRLKSSRLLANMPREGLYETRGYPNGGHGPHPYDVPPPRWAPWTPSQKRGGKKQRNRRWHRYGPRTDEVQMPRWI